MIKKLFVLSACFLLSLETMAQVIFSDNFDDGNLTANPVWTNNTSAFSVTNSGSIFNSTAGVTSNTANTVSYITSKILTNTNLSTINYTWRVLYRDDGPTDPDSYNNNPSNTFVAGKNLWRLWLATTLPGTNLFTANGYVLTHVGGNIILRRIKDNGTGYSDIAWYPISRGVTYSIRVTRVASSGLWTLYVDATTGEATTSRGGNTNNEVVGSGSQDIYTALEANNTTTTTNPNRFKWDNYSFSATSITYGCTTAGLASTKLFAGDNDKAVYSFQLTYSNDIPIKVITIGATAGGGFSLSGSGAIPNSNIKLIQSNNAVYGDGDDSDITSNFSVANNGSNIQFNASNGTTGYVLTGSSSTSVYFFLVVNISSSFINASGTIAFSMNSATTSIIQFVANNTINVTASYNCTGPTYSIGKNYDWSGNSDVVTDLAWTSNKNWKYYNGNNANEPPGIYDGARIGVATINQPLKQPVISSAVIVGSVSFGTSNSPVLNILSGSLTPNAGLVVNASATPVILGSGTITLPSGSVSSMASGATISIAPPLTNAGTFTNSGGLISLSGTLTNSGSFLTGSGGLTSTTFLNNSGTFTTGSGAVTFGNLAALSGGTFTTGSGLVTLSNGFDNTDGVFIATGNVSIGNAVRQFAGTGVGSMTFGAGTTTIASGVQLYGGVFTAGTGSISFGNGLQIFSGAVFNAGASPGTMSVISPFSNAGTFNPNTGTITFKGAYTNSGTFNYAAGTIIFDNPNNSAQTLIDNSSGGTTFNNVTFKGINTVAGVIDVTASGSGKYMVASTGTLTLGNTTTKVAVAGTSGILTLNSNASGSAVLAVIPSGSSITGNVGVQRYITGDATTSRGYRLISSPVSFSSGSLIYPNLTYISAKTYTTGTGGTTNGFNLAGNPTLYLYRENLVPNGSSFITGNYRGVSKINNGSSFLIDNDAGTFNIPAGNGVLLFFRGDYATTANPTVTTTIAKPTTFTAAGYLNQGDIDVKLWFTPSSSNLSYTTGIANDNVRGYNLVGNPYASSIDWDKKLTTGITSTNVGNTIWIYNPTLKTYATYIAGTPDRIGTNGADANIIPSGQGFFVRTSGTGATLKFTEAAKSTTQGTSSLLMSTAPVADAPVPQYLKLKLFKDDLNTDESLIFLKKGANTGFTVDEDAEYLKGNSTLNLSSRTTDKAALAINTLPFQKTTQTIPLNVVITSDGLYQLNMPEMKNIPKMYDIWLKDAYKKDSLDVRTNNSYSFNASTADAATFGANRFSIVIRPNAAYSYHLLDFAGAKQTNAVQLTWQTENEESNTFFTVERSTDGGKTFDVIGSAVSKSQATYSIQDNAPATGVNQYRLKQEDFFGTISYSKIVPVMYVPKTNAISNVAIYVYPNPVSTTLNLVINNGANKQGSYNITITNNTGLKIKTATTSQPEWSSYIGNLLPGNYFIQVINNNDNTVVGSNKFVKL